MQFVYRFCLMELGFVTFSFLLPFSIPYAAIYRNYSTTFFLVIESIFHGEKNSSCKWSNENKLTSNMGFLLCGRKYFKTV